MAFSPQQEQAVILDAPAVSTVRIQVLADVLQRFGRARLCVTGTSMLPTLWPGEVLLVERVEHPELRPGDVVLVQREQRLFCHRLLALVQREGRIFLRTRGDFLAAADPLVPVEDLLGRIQVPAARAPLVWLAPLLRLLARMSQRPIAWWVRRRARRAVTAVGQA